MLKYILVSISVGIVMTSCGGNATGIKQSDSYDKVIYLGKHITEDSALDCSDLKDEMGDAIEFPAKVKGEVIGVCPDNDCLLRIDLGDGTCMNVKMNNKSVIIPKDIEGKTAIVEGRAYVDTSAVKISPGYVSDSGRSVAETEATQNPEESLAFDATGVIIR